MQQHSIQPHERQQRPNLDQASARWPFGAIAYGYLVLLAGTNVPSPLYRGYAKEFGFTALTLALIFAVYVAALIPALLFAGPLSDAIGRRRVLVPGLAGAMAGSALFAAAENTGWLFAARVVQGISVGVASGALVAALSELEPHGDRRRAALVATMTPVCGIAIAPLVAGVLAQYGPAPHVTVFLLEIALLSPAIVAVALIPDNVTRTLWRPRWPGVPAPIRAAFAHSAISSFLAWAVTGLFLALIPSYLATLTGNTNLALAGGIVALMLGCSAIAQRIAYNRLPDQTKSLGLGLLIIGLGSLVAAGAASSLTLLLTATVLAGSGQGLAFLGAMTEVNRLAPTDRRAELVSTFLVATYLGTGVPVIGAGILAIYTGLLTAVQYFAVATAALCLLPLLLRASTTKPQQPSD